MADQRLLIGQDLAATVVREPSPMADRARHG
jgi:hypothetical protein